MECRSALRYHLLHLTKMYHQKTTQNAIAAMSRLAQIYDDPSNSAASKEIADSRNLPVPAVAKILTELSRGGLVVGAPGPGGGYRLARKPEEITLMDVVVLFERMNYSTCPFGPEWCGNGEPCPLHHSLAAMKQIYEDYLHNTTLAVFKLSHRKEPVSNARKRDQDKQVPKGRPKRKNS